MDNSTERERSFLRVIWQNRLFDCRKLRLADGTPVEIIDTGKRNDHNPSQPDFVFAAVHYPLKNVTMHGNIRIDTHSSHWRDQGTINTSEYSSVILHVVFERDLLLFRADTEIPTLVIQIPPSVALRYDELRRGICCSGFLGSMEPLHRQHLLTRLQSDRLKRKCDEIADIYNSTGNDWHETLYIAFMRTFGYKQSKQSFETLARSLPYRFIKLHSDSLTDIEAMLFGQAGFLNVAQADKYTAALQKRHRELSQEHHLSQRSISWNSGAIRPGSVPSQSIARIAVILMQEQYFLDSVLNIGGYEEFAHIFDVSPNEYWKKNISPSRPWAISIGGMSRVKIERIIINFVIPFQSTYGRICRNDEMMERALDLYDELAAEENNYTQRWAAGGYTASNAFFSQALIQLSSEYCPKGLCGSCPLGIMYISADTSGFR